MITECDNVIDRTKPQPYIEEIFHYIQNGKVLDVGAGWGRNSIYLAQKGFDVTAIEPSTSELTKLKKSSTDLGLNIQTASTDIRKIDFKEDFDVVLCAMVLHFLASQEEVKDAIQRLKAATAKGGINLVSVLHENNYVHRTYFFKPGELKDYYKDWKILDYSEHLGPRIPEEGGERFMRSVLIAQKQ